MLTLSLLNSSDEQGLATAPTPGGGAESLI